VVAGELSWLPGSFVVAAQHMCEKVAEFNVRAEIIMIK
jgi:hypothetical protein